MAFDVDRGVTFGFYARNDWLCLVATVLQETHASSRQFRDFRITPAYRASRHHRPHPRDENEGPVPPDGA
jgi:hypothetical protein